MPKKNEKPTEVGFDDMLEQIASGDGNACKGCKYVNICKALKQRVNSELGRRNRINDLE